MTLPPGITVRGLLSLSGLALLAALSYGLLRWVASEWRGPAPAESQAPLLIVERFHAARLNANGQRRFIIEAPRLAQYPGSLGTRIEQPTLDWYQADGQTREWRLQAEQAWMAADQQTLRLEGVTTMSRTADSGKPPMTMTTRDVLVRPNEQYAETAAPTRAVTPDGEFQAVGVRAWLDQERLELLSQVRGVYASPNP